MEKYALTDLYGLVCGCFVADSHIAGELGVNERGCRGVRDFVGYKEKEISMHTALLMAVERDWKAGID